MGEDERLTDEQYVKAKWPDAEMYIDFGGGFAVGVPSLDVTVSDGKRTRRAAWADAAQRIRQAAEKGEE